MNHVVKAKMLRESDEPIHYNLKCTLFTGHPVRRVHFALYD